MTKSRWLGRFIFASLLLLVSLPVWAGATLLPNGKQQFFNGSGQPLAGGQVFTYLPGTTTPANTWQDSAMTILNANPLTLDGSGMAIIYGSGNYREIVQDSLGNTIWDQLSSQLASSVDQQNGVYIWGGTATGVANTFNITVAPVPSAYSAGQAFRFVSNQNITGASQINVNTLGNKPITKFGGTNLASGDIVNGQLVYVVFDGTQFQMISTPGTTPTGTGTGVQTVGGAFAVDPTYFKGFIGGCILSNDATTPNTVIDITGCDTVSDDSSTLSKQTAFTKSTALWAVGTASGCLDSGAVTTSTWYHIFQITRTDTGNVDYLCSISLTSPATPPNYNKKRYIGSVKTDGASNLLTFVQLNDEFIWKASVAEINTAALTTARTIFNLAAVPPSLQTTAELRCLASNAAAGVQVILTSPDENDQAPGGTGAGTDLITSVANVAMGQRIDIRTSAGAPAQIGARSSAATTTLQCSTYGYINPRGKSN